MSRPADAVREPVSLDFSWSRRLPVLRQAETAECGLVCLAMIAAYHGHGASLETLRRRYRPSNRGLSLKHLVDVASHLGFSARPLQVEMSAFSAPAYSIGI